MHPMPQEMVYTRSKRRRSIARWPSLSCSTVNFKGGGGMLVWNLHQGQRTEQEGGVRGCGTSTPAVSGTVEVEFFPLAMMSLFLL